VKIRYLILIVIVIALLILLSGPAWPL